MNDKEFLVFSVGGERFAIPVKDIVRVVRASAIRSIAEAGDGIMGVLDVHGEILPVVDIRKRLSLPQKDIAAHQQFIIIGLEEWKVVMVVDQTEGVKTFTAHASQSIPLSGISNESEQNLVVARDPEGTILLYDLNKLLSGELAAQLENLRNSMVEK